MDADTIKYKVTMEPIIYQLLAAFMEIPYFYNGRTCVSSL